uniref:Eukaryotic translation initiation factor 2 beta subunit n=1 Tax=Arundo donax TaxID=35708 RepID=A0A0A9I0I3_ARUDO
MDARVQTPFFLRRTGSSSFVVNSVVPRGQLLPSRLDSLRKSVVGRPEPKLPNTAWILPPRSTQLKLVCRSTTVIVHFSLCLHRFHGVCYSPPYFDCCCEFEFIS